jgi:hypothetical protein
MMASLVAHLQRAIRNVTTQVTLGPKTRGETYITITDAANQEYPRTIRIEGFQICCLLFAR